jgi:hypothetical protein
MGSNPGLCLGRLPSRIIHDNWLAHVILSNVYESGLKLHYFILPSLGLRWAGVVAVLLSLVGSLLRCITTHQPTATWYAKYRSTVNTTMLQMLEITKTQIANNLEMFQLVEYVFIALVQLGRFTKSAISTWQVDLILEI